MFNEDPIEIRLPASKSISNRVLMLSFLSQCNLEIRNISEAHDTWLMQKLLYEIKYKNGGRIHCEDAGTVFRFLTSVLSIQPGNWVLTGTTRMRKRPIAPLVDALQFLGADITYRSKNGFPPLFIQGRTINGGSIKVALSQSSQYISSLIMLAPFLFGGLFLQFPLKEQVSLPYVEMTIAVMRSLGFYVDVQLNSIRILPSAGINTQSYTVENDWSAASYFYEAVALKPELSILLKGLYPNSIQGDSIVSKGFELLGVKSVFTDEGVLLTHTGKCVTSFRQDFRNYPDLAPTFAVCCAALKIPAELIGLSALKIKETDRLFALKTELEKMNIEVEADEDSLKITPSDMQITQPVKTYQDHRMAMTFAPLALLNKDICIEEKEVVKKSFPHFWEELSKISAI